jgi:uncharacterized protein
MKFASFSPVCIFMAVALILLFIPKSQARQSGLASLEHDIGLVRSAMDKNRSPNKDSIQPKSAHSPVGYVGLGLIKIYQSTISSQTVDVCSFTPSCSHFMESAIKRTGLIHGILLGSDRLLRCHPLARGHYLLLPDGTAFDPVEHYLEKGK